jgi:type I restriction enzyme M protein
VKAATLNPTTFDLSVTCPNAGEKTMHRGPLEIMNEIALLDAETAEVLETIKMLL